ncbi:flagellar assembly protein FliH [Herbinix hemicellulosilytica]|uniref:Flagellar assembly protein FliH/Type III secretion system HrpE domain-containing protein n=1 Tax=Herbinix hemicellulosilytica TaxID=1564487 RepID=A0A0H5SIF5_HERHM|nr:FliH/SctL family protein [Herbinix hemicellulosilytica]RBP60871.1 flagellar assembly protein FliH [Herbinix hemicellulosilytica]CRZ34566.1 hypothetical protein HHT355_1365 [Herbinix hemicellulosilytica]
MSNIIKAYSVQYKTGSKILIDYKDKVSEIEEKRLNKISQVQNEGEFEEGLQAVVVDQIKTEEEIKKETEQILEDARIKAAEILEEAKQEAVRIKEEAFKQASKQGYDEGIKKAGKEAEKLRQELNEQKLRQEKEYQMLLSQIEGNVAELVASLVTKITGILTEDKTDIILYLVEKGLRAYDNLDSYNIRVSSEDYDLLLSKKDYLEEITGCQIQISKDLHLMKNQCVIESENKVIDCSLDVQLNNLVNDLKLLSCI